MFLALAFVLVLGNAPPGISLEVNDSRPTFALPMDHHQPVQEAWHMGHTTNVSEVGTVEYQNIDVICTHHAHIQGEFNSAPPCGQRIHAFWDDVTHKNDWVSVRAYTEWERWLSLADIATPVWNAELHYVNVSIALGSLKQSEWTQVLKLCARSGRHCYLDSLVKDLADLRPVCELCGGKVHFGSWRQEDLEAKCVKCADLQAWSQNPLRSVTALISREVTYHIPPLAVQGKWMGWGEDK